MKTLYGKLITAQKKFRTMEKALNDQKQIVNDLKHDMIIAMNDIGTLTYRGPKGTVSMAVHDVPTVENWDKLYRYIHKHKAYDLLQRRVTTRAWADRVEAGEKIAAIKPLKQERLTITIG